MVVKPILHACSVVIRTPSQRGLLMLSIFPKILPQVGSEKKGGRIQASTANPDLIPRLEEAVKNHVAGSPVEPDVQWTNRTPTELAEELTSQGHSELTASSV